MLFNSITYALFFPLVLALYWLTRSHRGRIGLLFVASLVFYMSWNPPYVLLLFLSIGVDYLASHRMVSDPARKRLYLWLSVCTNLGVLGTFKYADFLLQNFVDVAGLLGLSFEPVDLGFILPLGISFYTFQTMSYTIDVYRGHAKPIDSLLVFATYVTFFPQLVAGPIVRIQEFGPQLSSRRAVRRRTVFEGTNRIFIGLIKKVLVADWLAALVEPVFASPTDFSPASNLIAVYAYAFQILFDFAGYCDIAIGCALLLGFRLPENFDRPYLSESITEFWRRWHMTLSFWLRDYLYIPLGGNRAGRSRTYLNLMLTMLLGGLWHGASWNFVVWGGLHGGMLAAHRIIVGDARRREEPREGLARWLRVLATFNLACLAWVFFRCQTFGQASQMLQQLAELPFEGGSLLLLVLASPALIAGYTLVSRMRRLAQGFAPSGAAQELAYGVALGGIVAALVLLAAPPAEFIYFQF